MSDRTALDRLAKAREPTSPGGTKLDIDAEIRLIEDELFALEGDKPRGMLSEAGYDAINGLRIDEGVDARAKETIARLKSTAAGLVWRGATDAAGVVKLESPRANLPVFINGNGWAVPRAGVAGQPTLPDILSGAYNLDEALTSQLRLSRKSLPDLLRPLSSDAKHKLIETLLSTANMKSDAEGTIGTLSRDESTQLRSSVFTDLAALTTTLDRAGDASLIKRVNTTLTKMATKEPDRWLGVHMAKMLNHPLYANVLADDDTTKLTDGTTVSKAGIDLFKGRIPEKFDVKNIVDSDGYVSWHHYAGQGENTYESFKATIREAKIHGASFQLDPNGTSNAKSCSMTLKFPSPQRLDDGTQIKGIKMQVSEYKKDMFNEVGNRVGISYLGHSDVGKAQEESLRRATAAGKKATTPQIAFLSMCGGLDSLDDDIKTLGNVDILTTHDTGYYTPGPVRDPDTGATFAGVAKSEGQNQLVQVLEGLTAGDNYEKIDQRLRSVVVARAHDEHPNVHTWTYKNWRDVLFFHTDFDGNGIMDARDLSYRVGLKSVPSDPEREFGLKDLPDNLRSDQIKGSAATDAVLDLNVATHYAGPTSHEPTLRHKFVADGFFESTKPGDLLRFELDETTSARKRILLKTNSRLAHTSREALAGLTNYQAMMWLSDQGLVKGLNETDRKIMAMIFAAFRLNTDSQDMLNDERIWEQLIQKMNLPMDIPFALVASAVEAETNDFAGGKGTIALVRSRLMPEMLAKLERPEVGRPNDG